MPKFALDGADTGPPGRKEKRTAYLIAVHQKRAAVRVYAVLAVSVETALTEVRALATDGTDVAVVGALSRDLARQLGLKPGEMRLV